MMQPNDPFLAQILASPADKDLRLIYADWLDERGDGRGELIRLYAQMSTLVPSSDEYARLKNRRKVLRQQSDAKWLTTMGYVARHRPLFTRLPRSRVERWRLVEEFIETWYHPLQPGDGTPEKELAAAERRLGCRLPSALREWYFLAGNRKDVWSKQDQLLPPSQLTVDTERDALLFYCENQGCERWGIRRSDLQRDDPPVYQFMESARASTTTTAFTILVLLCEVKFAERGVIWAGGEIAPPVILRELKRLHLRKCQVPNCYWVATPVTFYEGFDVIVETSENGWAYVTARTEEAFPKFSEPVRRMLERYR